MYRSLSCRQLSFLRRVLVTSPVYNSLLSFRYSLNLILLLPCLLHPQLVKNLYNVDLEPVKNKPPVWQKDVLVYALKDGDTHELIGYVYMDLFARPGQKQSGAWLQPFWDSAHYWRAPSPAALTFTPSTAVLKPANTNQTVSVQWTPSLSQQTTEWLEAAPKQVPLAMLICNQDPPAAGKPSLMTMDQAETVFHEFGHGLQHLLTKASQGLMTGMR